MSDRPAPDLRDQAEELGIGHPLTHALLVLFHVLVRQPPPRREVGVGGETGIADPPHGGDVARLHGPHGPIAHKSPAISSATSFGLRPVTSRTRTPGSLRIQVSCRLA